MAYELIAHSPFGLMGYRLRAHSGLRKASALVPRCFAAHPQRVLLIYGDSEAKEIARSLQKHIPVNKH